MDILQPKFPGSKGGRNISFLRIITDGEDSSVVLNVPSHLRREGEAIAVCAVTKKFFQGEYFFTTRPEDGGHEDLCRLLCKRGVRGNYLTWLGAIENDNKPLAEAEEMNSVIRFPCISLGEKEASKWKFS